MLFPNLSSCPGIWVAARDTWGKLTKKAKATANQQRGTNCLMLKSAALADRNKTSAGQQADFSTYRNNSMAVTSLLWELVVL